MLRANKISQSLMLKLFFNQCFPFELYLDLCLYCITGEGAKEEISWVSNQRFNGTVWSVFGGCHGGQTEDQLFSLMISWSSVCLLCQSYDQRMDPRRKGNHPAWTKPGLLPDTDTESPAQHRSRNIPIPSRGSIKHVGEGVKETWVFYGQADHKG